MSGLDLYYALRVPVTCEHKISLYVGDLTSPRHGAPRLGDRRVLMTSSRIACDKAAFQEVYFHILRRPSGDVLGVLLELTGRGIG